MIREAVASYFHIPPGIVENREEIFVWGAMLFAIGIVINLKRLFCGEELRIFDWEDILVYVSIILIGIGLLLMF